MKVIIDIEPELFNNIVARTQEGDYMSEVWLAVGHGEPYKTGKWITNNKGTSKLFNPGRHCSLCGRIVEFSENFCPSCGAIMNTKE